MIHKIGVKDFIIRGNVFRCMHKSHQIQNVDAEVKVSLNNGEDKLFQISAGYCQQCNVYFIMESTYQELKRNLGIEEDVVEFCKSKVLDKKKFDIP